MENALRAARRPPAGNEGLEKLLDFLTEAVQLRGRLGAAGAETVGVRLGGVLPAARALRAGGFLGGGLHAVADRHLDLRDDQKVREFLAVHICEECVFGGNSQVHVGLKALADLLLGAGGFEHAVDHGAHLGELLPVGISSAVRA